MASHHQHTAEIVPFPLNDYGGVRYLSPQQLARATRDPEMVDALLTADELRDLAYFARRDRIAIWERRIGIFCVVLALATMIYFAFQMGRVL